MKYRFFAVLAFFFALIVLAMDMSFEGMMGGLYKLLGNL